VCVCGKLSSVEFIGSMMSWRLLCHLVVVGLLSASVVQCIGSDSSGSSSEEDFRVLTRLSSGSSSGPLSGTSSGDSEESSAPEFVSVDSAEERPNISPSSSSSPVTRRLRRRRGRKPNALSEELLRESAAKGCSVGDIVRECQGAVSVTTVRRRLKAYGIVLKARLPASKEEYEELLKDQTVSMLASGLGYSKSVVERHMKKLGFVKYPVVSDEELAVRIRRLRTNDLKDAGVTFMRGILRSQGVFASHEQIYRVMKQMDPGGMTQRLHRKIMRVRYCVSRAMFIWHMDANEKLAKRYGIWIHGCVDGYSRMIVYLKASMNKLSSTVEMAFDEAVGRLGYPSCVRADYGGENKGVGKKMREFYKDALAEFRVLLGPSVHNQRIEYLWRFLGRFTLAYFRELFESMVQGSSAGQLRFTNEFHRYAMGVVFLWRVQASLDRFAAMWNHHTIRGKKCVNGHGGGIPVKLFEKSVNTQDRGYPVFEGEVKKFAHLYGVDPTLLHGERRELEYTSLVSRDILEDSVFARRVRDKIVTAANYAEDQGIEEFWLFVHVSWELKDLVECGWVWEEYLGKGECAWCTEHSVANRIARAMEVVADEMTDN